MIRASRPSPWESACRTPRRTGTATLLPLLLALHLPVPPLPLSQLLPAPPPRTVCAVLLAVTNPALAGSVSTVFSASAALNTATVETPSTTARLAAKLVSESAVLSPVLLHPPLPPSLQASLALSLPLPVLPLPTDLAVRPTVA
jgi:hypothetical protein